MNHDQLIDALANATSGDDLPDDARSHLAACGDCAQVARALEIVAAHPDAVASPPPRGYWDDFDERLAARLHAERERVRPLRRGAAWPAALGRLAAVMVLVLAGWVAVRGLTGGAPASEDGALARVTAAAPDLLVEEAEALTAGWPETWSERTDAWSLATSSGTSSDSDEWSGLLVDPLDPLDTVGDELAGQLTDDQAAELARRLRQEISS